MQDWHCPDPHVTSEEYTGHCPAQMQFLGWKAHHLQWLVPSGITQRHHFPFFEAHMHGHNGSICSTTPWALLLSSLCPIHLLPPPSHTSVYNKYPRSQCHLLSASRNPKYYKESKPSQYPTRSWNSGLAFITSVHPLGLLVWSQAIWCISQDKGLHESQGGKEAVA